MPFTIQSCWVKQLSKPTTSLYSGLEALGWIYSLRKYVFVCLWNTYFVVCILITYEDPYKESRSVHSWGKTTDRLTRSIHSCFSINKNKTLNKYLKIRLSVQSCFTQQAESSCHLLFSVLHFLLSSPNSKKHCKCMIILTGGRKKNLMWCSLCNVRVIFVLWCFGKLGHHFTLLFVSPGPQPF